MLYKNAIKLMKKKRFQLLGIGVIIFLSALVYTSMYSAMSSMEKGYEGYLNEYNQEDFSVKLNKNLTPEEGEKYKQSTLMSLGNIKSENVELYNKIIEDRISSFKENYKGYDIELRESTDLTFNDGKSRIIRALKGNKEINKTLLEEGTTPKNNNEVCITKVYGEKNNIKIGDTVRFLDKDYKVTGFVLFPDYTLFMQENTFNIDAGAISVALFSDEEFEKLKGTEGYSLGGKKQNGEFDLDEFKKISTTLPFVESFADTKGNMQSGMIYEEIKSGKVMTVSLSIMIASIALIIVGIIIQKLINGERAQIGVLKALGYTRGEIGKPYFLIILVITLPMLILGSLVGILVAPMLRDLYLQFYLLPKETITPDFIVILTAIIIPMVFFLGCTTLIINKILNKKALSLLRTEQSGKVSFLVRFSDRILSKTKSTTKFKYSFLLRNKGKFFVFLIGIFFSSMLILVGFMMPSFFSKMSSDYYEKKDYVYEGFVDMAKGLPKLEPSEERALIIGGVDFNDGKISLVGLEDNNKLHKLLDKKDKDITGELKNGGIITTTLSELYGVKVGDEIEVSYLNEKEKIKVVAIAEEYGDSKVYVMREDLSLKISKEFLQESKDLFNIVYSENKIVGDEYSTVINKNDALEQAESMQGFIRVALGGIIFTAVFLSVIILLILISLTIEDNYYNISLLKVMGYSKGEVNSMILNSYLGYSVMAYLISVPSTILMMDVFLDYFTDKFNMVFPFELTVPYGILGLVIVVIIFYIGSYGGKRKIAKISLQEIMKKYTS